ncbi:SulP family inorganic anion transporter [Sphingobium yanoikuyae]|uniref:SulP family inorganic anion transporter n=1 Tax=Sphingobium yanoikuyae TaxID=13690 RepID=A0A9X7YAH6_SPHYA|nr:SulP family inorganic anion transporter [Sphingobium yanoikuyae]QNG43437.1 SulP family inorganic anion transporter [Sphingobium yanoikuyae]
MSQTGKLPGNWKADLPASIVVALVALPLCLGVALASGAPLFSGIISGVVGGVVVGFLSRSPLSVSGPAAGLTVIVLAAIARLPSYETFLLAVVIAGVLQLLFGLTRSGVLSEFVPTSVITGMLAAIGIILILKQFPHAIGYDGDYEGDLEFLQPDGLNTFSTIWHSLDQQLDVGAALIAGASLAFLFWWDGARPGTGPLRFVPGPLVVVAIGVLGNALLALVAPALQVQSTHLVQVPVAQDVSAFLSLFRFPDFGAIANPLVWSTAVTIAIVASLESLLSVKAVDEIDPRRRVTDKNWELFAQGGGNIVSGMIGGIPVTSVIVRSSANVEAKAEGKLSTILHGVWLLLSVALIPAVLNLIPLSALAAILIATGYKLTKPRLFTERYRQGWTQFIPFMATIAAILFTDLLIGIGIGLVVGFVFVIGRNFRPAITFACEGPDCLIRARRNLYFIHKYELQKELGRVPDDTSLLIDLSSTNYVDLDNIDIINAFIKGAAYRNIKVTVRGDLAERSAPLINAPLAGVRFA